MSGVELTVVSGEPTPEEICAVVLALRLANAAGAAASTAHRGPARPPDPWPIPGSLPRASAVSWAAARRGPSV
ncbi:acyl-CoA carboxylase subunit epsilon [Streptomyces sp. CAU 1734]|uniref:acyl-CoA carboxylase epsilon subunit n=1 Tax=Streptomyces sp. CAU 1734 TaxID=3140360 RepID=UPI0032614CDE